MDTLKLNQDTYYTFKEYLKLEERANDKHEYHNGEIIRMPEVSLNRSLIKSCFISLIDQAIDHLNENYSVVSGNLKLYSKSVNHGIYPDVMVFCEKPQFYNNSKTVISNPELIIEVLSKSTKNYDLGTKFLQYRTLPSFKEYVVAWQTIPKVLSWYKESDNLWRISSAYGLDASIKLYTVDTVIHLKDVYKRINDLTFEDNLKAY